MADESGMSGNQPWLDTGNLASYFDQSAWAPYGFNGNIWGTYSDAVNSRQYNALTPEAQSWLDKNNYSLSGSAMPGDGNYASSLVDKSGNPVTSAFYSDADPMFGMLVDAGVAAVTGGALGGGGMFGSLGYGNALTGGLNGAFSGGLTAAGKEGNVLQGIVSGGIGGYAGNTDFAKGLSNYGITNPAVQKGVTAAGASTLANLASGNDLGGSLKSGLTSGITTGASAGMNDLFKNLGSNYLGQTDFADLQGSGGDMSNVTDVTPSSYDEASSNYRYSGDQPAPITSFRMGADSGAANQENDGSGALKSIQAYLPNAGQLGNFLGGNAGTLAQLMYGLYNNRKQQGALQNQVNGLQALYQQNSPYAQQLRAKLQAQAAAKGQRSNTAGRETQLQAQLADRAASLAPNLYQMQAGIGNLQNQFGQTLLGGFNKLGGLQGLQSLFNPSSSLTGPGAYQAYANMDNMYSGLGG